MSDYATPEDIIARYKEVNLLLQKPETLKDQNKIKDLSSELKSIEVAYSLALEFVSMKEELLTAKELLEISEAQQEITELKASILDYDSAISRLDEQIKKELRVDDPNDKRNCIVEIRSGSGGEEAALFANDLFRMYLRYAESNNWKVEILSSNRTSNGGLKELIMSINGNRTYGKLKFESGVHRVQRIPSTESSGRIHTSAASVVVLPEVEAREINISDSDMRIDTFRSSGPGGQSVNTTDSAVRITHIPTGIVVTCQDEKSQLKNKAKALTVLKSKLFDLEMQEKEREESSKRQASIKGGDRSAKIRTYNFPQSRVTDHRISTSWHNLENILDGDLEEVINTVKLELSQG